ncbi:MAG: 2-hydroxyacyl-CoA dehydratase [Lachnospiraceae bacterium]|nr:2-hydroxyacyl-CoA dehydratase [Lachnospiraceae bacterium]
MNKIDSKPSPKRALFTRQMKKTHTILLPQMLEYHSAFLQAAFEGSGYHFQVMNGGKNLKDKSLRYISNDYCYPAILIIGQMLSVLEEGRYPADRIAFMEPQAGGACRAGNYYHAIIRTLEKLGQEQIPVISLNFKGQESHPGFRITLPLLLSAIRAVCYGDLIMSLYQQVKPYECEKGATDKVRHNLERELAAQIREHQGLYDLSGKKRRASYQYILQAFEQIPVYKQPKKAVGVTGEVYIKFSSLGNHNLEKLLERQNCQCIMGGFINYAIYVVDSDHRNYLLNGKFRVLDRGYEFVLNYLEKVQRELYDAVGQYKRFIIDPPFSELKKKAENIIGYDCITGDGWLVAAETVAAIERGCKHVLILHPFGCLVSHVCERGIIKKLNLLYPEVNIQTIEYDYDSSDTLRESRILMGISDLGKIRKNKIGQCSHNTCSENNLDSI